MKSFIKTLKTSLKKAKSAFESRCKKILSHNPIITSQCSNALHYEDNQSTDEVEKEILTSINNNHDDTAHGVIYPLLSACIEDEVSLEIRRIVDSPWANEILPPTSLFNNINPTSKIRETTSPAFTNLKINGVSENVHNSPANSITNNIVENVSPQLSIYSTAILDTPASTESITTCESTSDTVVFTPISKSNSFINTRTKKTTFNEDPVKLKKDSQVTNDSKMNPIPLKRCLRNISYTSPTEEIQQVNNSRSTIVGDLDTEQWLVDLQIVAKQMEELNSHSTDELKKIEYFQKRSGCFRKIFVAYNGTIFKQIRRVLNINEDEFVNFLNCVYRDDRTGKIMRERSKSGSYYNVKLVNFKEAFIIQNLAKGLLNHYKRNKKTKIQHFIALFAIGKTFILIQHEPLDPYLLHRFFYNRMRGHIQCANDKDSSQIISPSPVMESKSPRAVRKILLKDFRFLKSLICVETFDLFYGKEYDLEYYRIDINFREDYYRLSSSGRVSHYLQHEEDYIIFREHLKEYLVKDKSRSKSWNFFS